MGLFSAITQSFKMAITGTVLRRIDTSIMQGHCTVSLRLKRNSEGQSFVVLAGIMSGQQQYFPMELAEFNDFVAAVTAIKAEVDAATAPTAQS